MIDLIGIGAIALAFTIILVLAEVERRRRRRGMGLPEIVLNEEHPRANGSKRPHLHEWTEPLPHKPLDWRRGAPEWTNPRRYGR